MNLILHPICFACGQRHHPLHGCRPATHNSTTRRLAWWLLCWIVFVILLMIAKPILGP